MDRKTEHYCCRRSSSNAEVRRDLSACCVGPVRFFEPYSTSTYWLNSVGRNAPAVVAAAAGLQDRHAVRYKRRNLATPVGALMNLWFLSAFSDRFVFFDCSSIRPGDVD